MYVILSAPKAGAHPASAIIANRAASLCITMHLHTLDLKNILNDVAFTNSSAEIPADWVARRALM
jgi:hypothetical protein